MTAGVSGTGPTMDGTGDPRLSTVASTGVEGADTPLFESGDELIGRIRDAIVLRRPVLVTGPRGSGKSYCARRAIELAIAHGEVGGQRFLQGNREIPREYLSEDMLVAREREGERPELTLIDALAVRHPTLDRQALRERRTEASPDWPALATGEGQRSGQDPDAAWDRKDWTVLFLDEINRFGEGFLDSLLSLTEERTIVRGGRELRVPITVVATANPPGYDVTAKKLSPPLQARMARSYRVAQPTLEALSLVILPETVRKAQERLSRAHGGASVPVPSQAMVSLAAGTCLCLWGTPNAARKGIGFLTPSTVALLEAALDCSEALRAHMDELAELVAFGPDARSVGDWLGAAMATAIGEAEVRDTHLVGSAIETLGHKLRETFNEGVEPRKAARVGELVVLVARTVLGSPRLRALFGAPYAAAAMTVYGRRAKSYETYMFARRFAAVELRPVVERAAEVATKQTAEGEVSAALADLRAYTALRELRYDLERRKRILDADGRVRTDALISTVRGHAKAIGGRRLADTMPAAVRAGLQRRIDALVGRPQSRGSAIVELLDDAMVPPHVHRALVSALHGRSCTIAQAHAASRFAVEMQRTVPPVARSTQGMIGRVLYAVSPALFHVADSLLELAQRPRGVDWDRLAKTFGEPTAGRMLRRVGRALGNELRRPAARELWERVVLMAGQDAMGPLRSDGDGAPAD